MKLWHVHRTDQCGYDEYDSFVVASETEEDARLTHPSGSPYTWTGRTWKETRDGTSYEWTDGSWPAPGKLIVREIGEAKEGERGVLCASFNAG